MSADYLAVVPDVPRSTERGSAEQGSASLPAISVAAIPADGPGPCSECAEGAPIPLAVAVVRYVSRAIRGPVAEGACLVCLPDLVATLAGFGEGPLSIELFSPCPPGMSGRPRSHRVARIDHERAELVRMLLDPTVGPSTAAVLRQCFAARTQDLARIARVGIFAGKEVS